MPGYGTGSVVLAGKAVRCSDDNTCSIQRSDANIVSQYKFGLQLLGHGGAGGECATASKSAMKFGVSLQTSCYRRYSRQELRTECLKQTTTRTIPAELLIDPNTVLGIYGNADLYNFGEWIQVKQEYPQAAVVWNETTSSCVGVINEVRIEVVTTLTGAVRNPQAKILYARMRYLSTTWAAGDSAATQNYPLVLSVQFKQLKYEETEEYIPPMPSVFPSLSDDIFYPFNAWNAGNRNGHAAILTTVALSSFVTWMLTI
jgi:hypothetical protein